MDLFLTWLLKKCRDLIILFHCQYINIQICKYNLVNIFQYIYVLCTILTNKFLGRQNNLFLQTCISLFRNLTIAVFGAANNFVYILAAFRAPTILCFGEFSNMRILFCTHFKRILFIFHKVVRNDIFLNLKKISFERSKNP